MTGGEVLSVELIAAEAALAGCGLDVLGTVLADLLTILANFSVCLASALAADTSAGAAS